MATNTSSMRCIRAVIGCTAPTGPSATGSVTSTRSSRSRRSSSAAPISASRALRAALTAPFARPTRAPTSLRACGGSAPISRLASAIGDRSPACASRAAFSSSVLVAPAKAASASATIASTWSASNGVTWTGS